jgi:hypothetical protein
MFDRETEVRVATPGKPWRGGRRPGGGRKANYLKQFSIRPISAAKIVPTNDPGDESVGSVILVVP